MALKEDYKDAVFAGLRKYKMLDNGDGTVSPVDMTEYETAGDKFGAKDVNAITKTVNATGEIIADDNDEFKPNQKYEIGRIVIYDNKTWRFKVDHEPGEWDERQVERTNILGEIAESKKQCNELTENLTWQLAGEVKGKKEILIPASAKEIYVEVGSDTSKLGTVTIPVIRLSEKDIKYNLYELYLNGQQYIRSIVVSKLRVIIGECKTADKDASSSTVTTMYYR